MRRVLPAVVVVAAFAALVSLSLTRGEQGKVIGSQHDLGAVSATAGVSACEVCHLPRDAGSQLLWNGDPHAGDASFSGIAPGCYSCHDGTVASSGLHVFDAGLAQHAVRPGEPGKDCDMCHDPHSADYGNFLLFPSGANLCKTCHALSGHPVNIAVSPGDAPRDGSWNPGAGDYSGTRLWDEGGSRSGTVLKCLSCHAAHGTVSKTLLSMATDDRDSSALCANCHRKGGAP